MRGRRALAFRAHARRSEDDDDGPPVRLLRDVPSSSGLPAPAGEADVSRAGLGPRAVTDDGPPRQVQRVRLMEWGRPVRSLPRALAALPWSGVEAHPVPPALGILRTLYDHPSTTLPPGCALSLGRVWQSELAGADRDRAFTACEVASLRNLRRALRNGAVWIEHRLTFRRRERAVPAGAALAAALVRAQSVPRSTHLARCVPGTVARARSRRRAGRRRDRDGRARHGGHCAGPRADCG